MKKLLLALCLSSPLAALADFRIIVPFTAGGAVDVVARTFATHVEKTTGKNVVVENVTGAGSIVGNKKLLESGDNVALLNSSSHYINIAQGTFAPGDFRIASIIAQSPLLVGVPASKKHTCQSLTAETGNIFIGTAGKDSITSVPALFFTERFKNYVEVPYKGVSQATLDLISGRIDILTFASMLDRPDITMIANTGPGRFEGLPSTKECFGINQTIINQFLLVTNKNASNEFVRTLNDLATKFVNSPEQAAFFKTRAIIPVGANLDSTRKTVEDQYTVWSKIYK